MKFTHVEAIRSLAVVGATGLVGREFLELLAENKIKIPKIKLLASEDSAGDTFSAEDQTLRIEALDEKSFEGIEVAFFSLPNEATRQFVPAAVEAGTLVLDDSSVFRMDPEVPLILPEINGALLRDFQGSIISTPNCSAAPLALSLKVLQDHFGLERVVVSTYQSVSGAGRAALQELSDQAANLLNGMESESSVFPHRIAFNCLPLIGGVLENGYSDEEDKIVRELKKILEQHDLRVSAMAVRVPTFCGHGLSVNVELREDFESVEKVREMMDAFPGLKVLDRPDANIYPTNEESTGSDYTFVGRLRRDYSVKFGLNFWVITDNLRKGAALNVLQTLDTLYKYRRMS